ncbi:hypothetical protein IF1G_09259 [Cordyceps javanica]|uniref:Uncharacterized protein n=1 Tax=Cordyceps javanica TaxID=43265 RepID=A0A545URU2_9HYPO|nr:hypothetical protein IF1G_09259 [Cordyceps javanica]
MSSLFTALHHCHSGGMPTLAMQQASSTHYHTGRTLNQLPISRRQPSREATEQWYWPTRDSEPVDREVDRDALRRQYGDWGNKDSA